MSAAGEGNPELLRDFLNDPIGDPDPTPDPTPTPDPAALQQELQTLREAREAVQRELQAEREARARQQGQLDAILQAREAAPQNNEPTPDPMPDPATEPQAFAAWQAQQNTRLMQSIDQRLQASETRLASHIENKGSEVELWNLFREKYPVHAQRLQLAKTAFNAVANQLPTDPQAAVDLIRDKMNEIAGTDLAALSKDPTTTTPPDRTAGLSGGDKPAPKPAKPKAAGADAPHETMHDAQVAWKQKYGLI